MNRSDSVLFAEFPSVWAWRPCGGWGSAADASILGEARYNPSSSFQGSLPLWPLYVFYPCRARGTTFVRLSFLRRWGSLFFFFYSCLPINCFLAASPPLLYCHLRAILFLFFSTECYRYFALEHIFMFIFLGSVCGYVKQVSATLQIHFCPQSQLAAINLASGNGSACRHSGAPSRKVANPSRQTPLYQRDLCIPLRSSFLIRTSRLSPPYSQ